MIAVMKRAKGATIMAAWREHTASVRQHSATASVARDRVLEERCRRAPLPHRGVAASANHNQRAFGSAGTEWAACAERMTRIEGSCRGSQGNRNVIRNRQAFTD